MVFSPITSYQSFTGICEVTIVERQDLPVLDDLHQFGRTCIQHPEAVMAGPIAERHRKIAFARSCPSRNDKVFAVAYELHNRKPFDLITVETPPEGIVDE